jgi:hypothetical protein
MSGEFDASDEAVTKSAGRTDPAAVGSAGEFSSSPAPVYETTSDAFKRRFMWRLIVVLIGGMLLDGYILGLIGPVTTTLAADWSGSEIPDSDTLIVTRL